MMIKQKIADRIKAINALNSYLRAMSALMVLCLVFPGSSSAAEFGDAAVTHIDYPAWFEESAFLDMEESLASAKESGKSGLMLLFTTEGCSYCDQFIRVNLADEATADQVQKGFVSIGLEIFDDAEMTTPNGEVLAVKAFAQQQGVEFAPTLLFFDVAGERMARFTGYQAPERFGQVLAYLESGAYKSGSFRTYLAANISQDTDAVAGLKADPMFESPPYALDRSRFAADKPLMVLFGRGACAECEDFHRDVLANKEVRDTLQRFDVVQLDVDDMKTPVLGPDGSRLNPAEWYAETNLDQVPALVFFSETGEEVLSTDALVLSQRMLNSLNFVLERAYEKGWTYQRFARTKGIERAQKRAAQAQ